MMAAIATQLVRKESGGGGEGMNMDKHFGGADGGGGMADPPGERKWWRCKSAARVVGFADHVEWPTGQRASLGPGYIFDWWAAMGGLRWVGCNE